MTRETKIGLLVGLAFIIVIGILLSDQLMRSTEPPAAPLATVADTVRKATVTPAAAQQPVAKVTAPQEVTPASPVRTREEITPPAPPVTFVEIRPAGGGATQVIQQPAPRAAQPAAPTGPIVINGGSAGTAVRQPVVTRTPDAAATGGRSIAEVAAAMGEPLVGPDGQPLRASLPRAAGVDGGAPRVTAANLQTAGMKQYKVEQGDTLSKIASKFYGANTKANRDLIIKANPSLAADPNKVIIGATYNIPVASAAASAVNQPQSPTVAPVAAQPVTPVAVTQTPAPAAGGEGWYTVKEGDSLWKIARDQCGDPALVAAIKELNKESLKGSDRVVLNMKLRLPARPIASAQ